MTGSRRAPIVNARCRKWTPVPRPPRLPRRGFGRMGATGIEVLGAWSRRDRDRHGLLPLEGRARGHGPGSTARRSAGDQLRQRRRAPHQRVRAVVAARHGTQGAGLARQGGRPLRAALPRDPEDVALGARLRAQLRARPLHAPHPHQHGALAAHAGADPAHPGRDGHRLRPPRDRLDEDLHEPRGDGAGRGRLQGA